jgi:hypothetical protein
MAAISASSGASAEMPVRSFVAAVVEAADVIVTAKPSTVTLHPGESATIDVEIKRNHYTGPVELNVISWNLTQEFSHLPNGIVLDEKQSKTALADNETHGRITLRALPDAPPLKDYLTTIMAQIAYVRIFMTRSAAPVRLTVSGETLASAQPAQ